MCGLFPGKGLGLGFSLSGRPLALYRGVTKGGRRISELPFMLVKLIKQGGAGGYRFIGWAADYVYFS